MKFKSFYMSYNKNYGAWIVGDDEVGRPMQPGEHFRLCLGKGVNIACSLEWNGKQTWSVHMGPNDVKLNLCPNEIYYIEI